MKKLLKKLLARIWLMSFGLFRCRKSYMPVLCYHSLDTGYDSDVEPLDPAMFEQHLIYLKKNYEIHRLQSLGETLVADGVLPENTVVLTFDDGYRDNYTTLFPLLKKYDVPATIFLVSGFIDGRVRLAGAESWEPMNWAQVREMHESGLVDFGGHSDTHSILADLDDEDAVRDVMKSLDLTEKELGDKVRLFAYPFGQGEHIPPCAIKVLEQSPDIICACSTFWRTTHKPSERYLINRVTIGPNDTVSDLSLKVRGGYDYIYYWQKLRALISVVIKRKGIWR